MKILMIWLALVMPSLAVAEFDHTDWDQLLKSHVVDMAGGQASAVNYDGMMQDRDRLRGYLDALARVNRDSFETWPQAEQLAFLINAYNAWTVELILTEWPDIDSIRDIGFLPGAPWRRNIVSLFGGQVSLDDVEHGMIRGWGRYNEPRIHFAVNCAAIGCPALRNEAYRGADLEQQLDDNTRLFLSDRSRNYFSEGNLYVSQIFDWYGEDFERGWQGMNSLEQFLLTYARELDLSERARQELGSEDLDIRFLRYDWDLNKAR